MIPEELKDEPWTVERAIGTIGAFIEGGDELGLVGDDEAATAYNVLCDALSAMTAERDALKSKYADLEDDNIALRKQLVTASAERDAVKAQLDEMEESRDRLIRDIGMY